MKAEESGETEPGGPVHGPISSALRFAIAMPGVILLATAYFLACIPLLPWRHRRIRLGNRAGAALGRWVLAIAGISHEIVGTPPEASAPAIFVQNHSGTLDLFLAMQLCPAPGSGAMKKELLRIPFLGLGYLLSGHLLVDRGNRERAIAAMEQTGELVRKHGISIWILPEGHRSRDGRLQPFKKGFAHLALDTRLPIVPVVVHDGHRFWQRGLKVRPGRVKVEMLAPIPTVAWKREELDERIAQIHALFERALAPHQRPAV